MRIRYQSDCWRQEAWSLERKGKAGAVVTSDSEPLVALKRCHDASVMLNMFSTNYSDSVSRLPPSRIAKLIKRNVHRALARTSSALSGESCYAISIGDRECKIL